MSTVTHSAGVSPSLSSGLFGIVTSASQRLRSDAAKLVNSIKRFSREEKGLLGVVALLTLFAAVIRAFYLSKGMGHDETYTYIMFASQGLWTAISNYSSPNNHIFHSLLVLISTQLFGNAPWAIRLPAFLFGVLTVPATALLGLALYGRRVALLSAAGIAILPIMINYSVHARGYSGLAFFSVILWLLAYHLRQHENVLGWALFVLTAVLGFFTHPTMLYSFGMTITWLFLSALWKDVGQEYDGKFLYDLIGAGAATVLLTLAIYTPVFIESGPEALFRNQFVQSLDWGTFVASIPGLLISIWELWIRDLNTIGMAIFVAGLVAAAVFGRNKARHKVPLGLAALLWIVPVLAIQRVAPYPRVWLFLLPLFVIWAAAGWVCLLEFFEQKLPATRTLTNVIFMLLIIIPLCISLFVETRIYLKGRGQLGYHEETAIFLKSILQPGDMLVTTFPDATVLRYYLARNGVRWDYAENIKEKEFRRAVLVVNTRSGQTADWLLRRMRVMFRVNFKSAQVVYRRGPVEIYTVQAKQSPDSTN